LQRIHALNQGLTVLVQILAGLPGEKTAGKWRELLLFGGVVLIYR